jgi:hypothetical protein
MPDLTVSGIVLDLSADGMEFLLLPSFVGPCAANRELSTTAQGRD